ncbi:hypothetical protein FA13DRAFT_1735764 [Coprinellus micaceus]|uniref:Uncharacterized protein n=1 Tax=Coprinellus micaceus TaxID=71717 RepID=A0A4Y7T399_COPMI|nr:hypothetical protein FA13DRAFT_1735764 [Coprinellus micaceus]
MRIIKAAWFYPPPPSFRLNLGMSDTPNSPRILKWSSRLGSSSPSRPSSPLRALTPPSTFDSRRYGLFEAQPLAGWVQAEARAPYTRPDNPLKQVLDAKNPLHEHLSGSPELGSAAAAPSLNLVPATPPIGSSDGPKFLATPLEAPNGCSEPPPKPWIATKASYDLDRLTPA